MSQKIDTLKELREEIEQLEKETVIARQYLGAKLEYTYSKGKRLIVTKTSWPLAVSSLAALGAQQLEGKKRTNSHYGNPSEFHIMDGIEQGIAAMQQPGKEKWYAMIPIALRFLENWLSGIANETSNSETKHYNKNEYRTKPTATNLVPPPVSAVG